MFIHIHKHFVFIVSGVHFLFFWVLLVDVDGRSFIVSAAIFFGFANITCHWPTIGSLGNFGL